MNERLALLYPAVSATVIDLIVQTAEDFVKSYCNIEEIPPALQSCLLEMCRQDINKIGAEGFSSESAGGANVSYETDYTKRVYKELNRYRKVRVI